MRMRLTSRAVLTCTGADDHGLVVRTGRDVGRTVALCWSADGVAVIRGRGALLLAVGRTGQHEVTVPLEGAR